MALIGISLIVASVVLFCLRPPAWIPHFLATLRHQRLGGPAPTPPVAPSDPSDPAAAADDDDDVSEEEGRLPETRPQQQALGVLPEPQQEIQAKHSEAAHPQENGAVEPSTPTIQLEEPREERPHSPQDVRRERGLDEEAESTPKASAAAPAGAVPSFVLSEPSAPSEPLLTSPPQQAPPAVLPPQIKVLPDAPRTASDLMPPPPPPPPPPAAAASRVTTGASDLMPPPPVPKPKTRSKPTGIPQPSSSSSPRRIPTLNGTASPAPNRSLPIPRRGARPPSAASSSSSSSAGGGGGGGGGLAPPPTATSIPKKPSRQVNLEPGHSPLDWARLAQSPTSDLRGLPANTPYLRVTPSMLKQQNGRKGRDAWSVFGGKVYNISPYIPFHPGGGPELLRGAGKDGTRLFAEVHPWVNYETMLQSCLIGLLVEEHDEGNKMEEMD